MTCSLSTHVLDTGAGEPAAGVTVELAGPDGAVVVAETDGDGRARLADGLAAGTYRLVFHPPSPFFTRHHRDHHSARMYGTRQDPEYIVNVFRPGSALSLAAYVLLIMAFPLMVFFRFLLAPLTFVHPRVREWTLRHASSLTMNYRYERRLNRLDRWAVTTTGVSLGRTPKRARSCLA
jgi:hypothetical protein